MERHWKTFLQQLKKKKKATRNWLEFSTDSDVLEETVGIYHMKHLQGIAQNKVTDDCNNDHYFCSPCQHSEQKKQSCLELQRTLMKIRKTSQESHFTFVEVVFTSQEWQNSWKVMTMLQVDDNFSGSQRKQIECCRSKQLKTQQWWNILVSELNNMLNFLWFSKEHFHRC